MSVNLTDLDRPLNRAERRAALNNLRAFRKRAARRRDQECKRRGIGTPDLDIATAIRRAGSTYTDTVGDPAYTLIDRLEPEQRQQAIEGSARHRRKVLMKR